jgi:hypothetical protein
MRLLAITGLALACLAQAQTITVPSGTKIPLRLTSPLNSRTARVGDSVRAETAFPVAVDTRVAIPAGAYVEGAIDKVTKSGAHAGFEMHFTRLILANGYTVPISGSSTSTLTAELDVPEGTDAVGGGMASSLQSSTTPTLTQPSMPGSKTGLFVGIAVATAAVAIISAVVLRGHGGGMYLDAGSSLEMVLASALPLDAAKLPTGP